VLLRFAVSNYASIRDHQELSLIATDRHDNIAVRDIPNEDEKVLPVAGIFGANASGKSNVVRALDFMIRAIIQSHQQWRPMGDIPRRPFLFDKESKETPSRFVIDFVVDNVRHRYGFRCDDYEFLEEWLFSYPEQRRRLLFHRVSGEPVKFGTYFTGQRKLIESVMRPNSLYLSAAVANNHPELSRVYEWFSKRCFVAIEENSLPRLEYTVSTFKKDKDLVLALLEFADLDIVDLEIKHRKYRFIQSTGGVAERIDPSQVRPSPEISVVHRVKDVDISIPLNFESSGTQAWLSIIGAIADVLRRGNVLVIDELDARLHSTLAGHLVRLFQEKATNRNGAQLFFNSHDTTLLGPTAPARLRRDQVWFTAKEDGATKVYPLTDYRVREGLDNVEKSYLRGRYGAVPVIGDNLISHLAD
jgi:AAA15 family ATPase/GTPase